MDRFEICVEPELKPIMDRFLEIRHAELAEMEQALASEDVDRLILLGHRLKGCGSSYGMHELTELGHAIEEAASDKRIEAVSLALGRIREYLEHVDIVYGEPNTS